MFISYYCNLSLKNQFIIHNLSRARPYVIYPFHSKSFSSLLFFSHVTKPTTVGTILSVFGVKIWSIIINATDDCISFHGPNTHHYKFYNFFVYIDTKFTFIIFMIPKKQRIEIASNNLSPNHNPYFPNKNKNFTISSFAFLP